MEEIDGFARRKERSKNYIRKAAWELFSQFGVEKVTIADIARKAGVSPATIYNNFDGKDALIREFVAVSVEQLAGRFRAILALEKSYEEKMAAFFQFISSTVAQEGVAPGDGAVFTSSIDLQNDPEMRRIHDMAKEEMTELLLGLVREGKEQGRVSPDISDEALAIYFNAFMDIFIDPGLQVRFRRRPALVQNLGSLMMRGLVTDPAIHRT